MILTKNFLENNDCYKAGKKIAPKGLMIHSIGYPQPSAGVIIGRWNKPNVKKCVHGFIEPNGKVYQTLPWDYRGWHGGGSSNDAYIGCEMTEPATIKYTSGAAWVETGDGVITKQHVLGTYKTAVELFAFLCKEFKLDPLKEDTIISHSEGYKLGIASNHGDVEHIWSRFGLTMAQFRKDIRTEIQKSSGKTVEELVLLLNKTNPKIITNIPKWITKATEDKDIFYLISNMAGYIGSKQ